MATYQEILVKKGKPQSGVHAAVYENETSTVKIDVDVSDENGILTFNDLQSGKYHLRFWGKNYSKEDWKTIEVFDNATFTPRVYIRPLNGTVIKNGSGTLSFEMVKFNGSTQVPVQSGNIKLYTKASDGTYQEIIEDPNIDNGVVSFDDYSIEINANFIDGKQVLYAADTDENIEYDSVTLADVTDGIGFIGWTEVSSYVATFDPDTEVYSPSSITMQPKFALSGDILADGDSGISYEIDGVAGSGLPDSSASGVSVDEINNTGEVTITTADYFGGQTEYTAK